MQKLGAGGYWKRLNETKDLSVVQQKTALSCVAAVGEMLLQTRGILMTQAEIIAIIGEVSTTEHLANLLNKVDKSVENTEWHGIIIAVRHLEKVALKGNFGAVLREGSTLGHLVLVETLSNKLLKIKDTWDATSYQMTVEEFLQVWNGEIIFRWNLSE
jgi:Peptidase C39 family